MNEVQTVFTMKGDQAKEVGRLICDMATDLPARRITLSRHRLGTGSLFVIEQSLETPNNTLVIIDPAGRPLNR